MKVICLIALFASLAVVYSQSLADGLYYVRSVEYGTYWDSCEGNAFCGNEVSNVVLNQYYADILQRFYFAVLPNGYYTITLPANGRNLAAAQGVSPVDSLFLTATPDSNEPSQQFRLVAREDGGFIIKPRINLMQAITPQAGIDIDIILDGKDCVLPTQHFMLVPVIQGFGLLAAAAEPVIGARRG